jgi:hypothetical protein
MLNKSTTLKNYLKEIGTKNQLFFLFGQTPSTITSNTAESGIDAWKNSEMSYRVAKKDSVAVVPNNTWSAGNVYNTWTSKSVNTGTYYVWNKTNGIVYLCISNNSLNRKDLSMTSASRQAPSHLYGLQTYADGYTWLSLYKITADLLRFVSSTWIPVISFDDYRENDTSKYTTAERFCNNFQGEIATCGVFFKNANTIETSLGTFTNYTQGTRYYSAKMSCQTCYYLFENDDNFVSFFYPDDNPPTSITIKDKFDIIEELVNTNQISTSSPYYSLYTISANGLADGAVVSALLDLNGFDQTSLVVDEANPEIQIASASGTGARLIFTTYRNTDGENIINGVSLLATGQNYKDLNISIDYSKFPYLTSTQVDTLLAAIEINIDILDGLNFDPVSALSAESIMFDIRIETNVLKQQNVSIPNKINFYGLIENPIEVLDDGLEIVAGSQYGKDNSYVEKTTTKLQMTVPSIPTSEDTPPEVTLSNGTVLTSAYIHNVSTDGANATAELTGINYKDADQIVSLTIDSTVYTVDTVLSKPSFKQYSGKVSQTKKLSSPLILGNETTNTENTKVFRINIVKGF